MTAETGAPRHQRRRQRRPAAARTTSRSRRRDACPQARSLLFSDGTFAELRTRLLHSKFRQVREPDRPTGAARPTGSGCRAAYRAPQPWCPDGPQPEVALGDRIAELSARIQAATWELLSLIRQFDERYGWAGCTSCAESLGWRTWVAPEPGPRARAGGPRPRRPAEAERRERRGKVSYSKMRAVTRVATPEIEDDLLNVALSGTAAHVEKIVRAWRRVDRLAEQAEDRRRHETRSLRTWVDENGMVVVRGRLSPEVGAVVRRALRRRVTKPAAPTRRHRPRTGKTPSRRGGSAVAGAATSGCAGGDCRVRPFGRTRPGDGGRPVSGGGAHGRGRPDRSTRRSRSARRSRGNIGDGIAPARAAPATKRARWPFDERTVAGRRALARPLCPGPRPSVHPGRLPPDGAGRGRGHPHLGGDGAAAGLRCSHGLHAAWPRRRDLCVSSRSSSPRRPSRPVANMFHGLVEAHTDRMF